MGSLVDCLPRSFTRFRPEIDSALRRALTGREAPLFEMLRYHLGWVDATGQPLPGGNGKALRPVLCLLSCSAETADYRRALPAAAALELVHNFSLIHDDIQDDDAERRGRATVWSVWGKPQAINAGTAMRILAGLTLRELGAQGVPLARQMQAQYLLDESCLQLIEGQYLDISFERRLDISTADYLEMIEKKTACLITCALEMGALLATDDAAHLAAFRALGHDVGLAFQIRDDMLGIWGRPESTGKPLYSDIRRHKKSLPIVYALEQTGGAQRAEFMEIYRNGLANTQAGIDTVLGILADIGAQEAAQAMVESYRSRALGLLDSLDIRAEPKAELREVINFLAGRDF